MTSPPVFKDHFSTGADSYEKHRPGYPPELYAWLAGNTPGRELAVDVATGNGQAALGLAEYFDAVAGCEPSAAQLAEARAHPRVSYRREAAERMSFADGTVDLLVAAQAAHWFDWPAFTGEARRVLRPGGLLAIWSYGFSLVTREIDRLVEDFSRDVVGPWWPRERRHVEERYSNLPLPFPALAAPPFEMRTDWNAPAMLAYIGTWSAVRRYRARVARDPLELLAGPLAAAWGDAARPVRWPLVVKACRASAPE